MSAIDHNVLPFSLAPIPRKQSHPPQTSPSYTYDFHPARLDPVGFPSALWRTCFLECLRESSGELSRYGDPPGDWGLRGIIQQYLERSRGVLCEPDQIVICAGLLQGLEIVGHLLKEDHSSVAVENPGYHLPRAILPE